MDPKGTLSIDVAVCMNEYAYVQIGLPHLMMAVRQLLSGDTWEVHLATLPNHAQATIGFHFCLYQIFALRICCIAIGWDTLNSPFR